MAFKHEKQGSGPKVKQSRMMVFTSFILVFFIASLAIGLISIFIK